MPCSSNKYNGENGEPGSVLVEGSRAGIVMGDSATALQSVLWGKADSVKAI